MNSIQTSNKTLRVLNNLRIVSLETVPSCSFENKHDLVVCFEGEDRINFKAASYLATISKDNVIRFVEASFKNGTMVDIFCEEYIRKCENTGKEIVMIEVLSVAHSAHVNAVHHLGV